MQGTRTKARILSFVVRKLPDWAWAVIPSFWVDNYWAQETTYLPI